MKATGIVRKVVELGRVVLPIELRRNLDINEKDALEIYVDEDKIILKKYEPACIFCNQSVDTVVYKGKNICANLFGRTEKIVIICFTKTGLLGPVLFVVQKIEKIGVFDT